MPGIVMNVGPNAIAAAGGGGGGGGQTLGNAQGSITINVNNVTQANSILQQSARQMSQAFAATGRAAQQAAQQQIQAARVAAANARSNATIQAAANRTVISGLAVSSAQQNAAHRQQMRIAQQQAQAARTTSAQQSQAYQATSQAARLSYQQQSQAAKLASQAAQQGYQTQRNAVQSQLQNNRLIVSGYQVQAAQARAAARAQAQAAQQAMGAWAQVAPAVNKAQASIIGLSAGAGLLAVSGIQYAASMQEAQVQLTAMTGSQQRASVLMEDLRKKGKEAGIPFQQMTTFAAQLLPTLNKNTKELDKWFDIARRVAVLNRGPMGGLQGAAFSLREAFLSVQSGGRDFVSLADRFNISKVALIRALEVSGGDFVKAIELVLDDMGITIEMADEMANTFNASFAIARDSAMQLIATGFEPLMGVIASSLRVLADWVAVFAQGNPEIVAMAAGLVSIVAVGGPLLLLVNQMIQAWAVLGATAQSAILKMMGIAGVAVAAYTLGKGIGQSIGGFIRQSRGQTPLTDEQVGTNFRTVLFNLAVDISHAGDSVSRAIFSLGAAILEGAAWLYRQLQSVGNSLADSIPVPAIKRAFQKDAERQGAMAFQLENLASGIRKERDKQTEEMYKGLVEWGKNLGLDVDETLGAAQSQQEKYNQKQIDRMVKYEEDKAELEADTQERINESTENHGRQRANTIRNFNKQMAREEEDFARQRANSERRFNLELLQMAEDSARQRRKWEEELERTIAQARQDSAERVADMNEEHDERIADMRKDSAERIADLEEDLSEKIEEERADNLERIKEIEDEFNRDRLKAQRDHAESMHQAAARFDAFALAREQREFERERQEAAEEHRKRLEDERNKIVDFVEEQRKSHNDRIAEERENLQERVDEENKSHAKRLEDEAEALEKSIRQQREAHALRLADQAEEDAIRRQRMIDAFIDARRQEDIERGIQKARAIQDHNEQIAEMDRQHGEDIAQIQRHAADARAKMDKEFADDMVALGVRLQTHEEKMQAYEESAIRHFDNVWDHMLNRMQTPPFLPDIPPQFPGPYAPGAFPVLPGLPSSNQTTVGGTTFNVNIYPQANQSPEAIGSSVVDEYIKRVGPGYKN